MFLPLLGLLLPSLVAANNVVATTNSRISILASNSQGSLITKKQPSGSAVNNALPSGISAFSDVSIDPEDETKVFALSTNEGRVCSFNLNTNNAQLTLVNCVGNDITVSPATGVSAYGGTLIISGGIGGFTVYPYDTGSGSIQSQPLNSEVELPAVVGHPDVVLIDSNLAALSTDFSRIPRFGTMMVDGIRSSSPAEVRDFRIANNLGFSLALLPTNFPVVNAVFRGNGGPIMYTANGAITVQDPRVDGSSSDISTLLSDQAGQGIRAITAAVDTPGERLVVGGQVSGGSAFVVQVYSIADPFSPTFVSSQNVNGRLASVAVTGSTVVYTDSSGVTGRFELEETESPPRDDEKECDESNCSPSHGLCVVGKGGVVAGCACKPGYFGEDCSVSDPSMATICTRQANGSIVSSVIEQSMVTQARSEGAAMPGMASPSGEVMLGPKCELVDTIDACSSTPCLNGATCCDSWIGFQCTCSSGFSGELCDQSS